MAVKHQRKPAPKATAPVEEHRRHADEVIADEKYKQKPAALNDRSDEANP
jgi:hypothetical protein